MSHSWDILPSTVQVPFFTLFATCHISHFLLLLTSLSSAFCPLLSSLPPSLSISIHSSPFSPYLLNWAFPPPLQLPFSIPLFHFPFPATSSSSSPRLLVGQSLTSEWNSKVPSQMSLASTLNLNHLKQDECRGWGGMGLELWDKADSTLHWRRGRWIRLHFPNVIPPPPPFYPQSYCRY